MFLEGCDEISAGALKHIKTPQANFLVTIIINVNVLILMTTSPKFHINPEKSTTLREKGSSSKESLFRLRSANFLVDAIFSSVGPTSGAATAAGRCTGRTVRFGATSFWDPKR